MTFVFDYNYEFLISEFRLVQIYLHQNIYIYNFRYLELNFLRIHYNNTKIIIIFASSFYQSHSKCFQEKIYKILILLTTTFIL